MRKNKNGFGPLRDVLEHAVAETIGASLKSFTVLSDGLDPYRLDTEVGHRNAKWFDEMVERFLPPDEKIHLRGLFYRLVGAGDVADPGGKPWVNAEERWTWFTEKAAKAARWLGYVPFSRIIDERNAPAQIFVRAVGSTSARLHPGAVIEVPDLAGALPAFYCPDDWIPRQRYRMILIGEKVSLSPILQPIAEEIGGELLLPTGEISDTQIHEFAQRANEDGRMAVVFYFSDFDPAGHQMPISVSRKLQALRDLLYPELSIEVHAVALTLEQVRELDLPSTPLKATEQRADQWRDAMSYEQTEIDALIALEPSALEEIAREAIRPFYDETLARRTHEAQGAWYREADGILRAHPAYSQWEGSIERALTRLRAASAAFRQAQAHAYMALAGIEPPPISLPDAELAAESPQPLFGTYMPLDLASERLIKHKALDTSR